MCQNARDVMAVNSARATVTWRPLATAQRSTTVLAMLLCPRLQMAARVTSVRSATIVPRAQLSRSSALRARSPTRSWTTSVYHAHPGATAPQDRTRNPVQRASTALRERATCGSHVLVARSGLTQDYQISPSAHLVRAASTATRRTWRRWLDRVTPDSSVPSGPTARHRPHPAPEPPTHVPSVTSVPSKRSLLCHVQPAPITTTPAARHWPTVRRVRPDRTVSSRACLTRQVSQTIALNQ